MIETRHLSWQSIWRVVAVLSILGFIYYAKSVLAILFFAIIIFAAFDPVVSWFQKKKLSRILGSIIVYFLVAAFFTLITLIIAPVFYREIISVADLIPGYSEKFLDFIIGSKFAQNINEVILSYGDSIIQSGSTILSIFFDFVGGITAAISALLISFYLLIKKNGILGLINIITPASIEPTVINIWEKVRVRVGYWFRTQLLLSLIVGILVYISLVLLGVKYALVLAVLAAVLEIVPVVGPIFSGAISVLVALSQSASIAIWIIAIFIIIQQIESNIFVPLMMKKSVGLNPVLVIIAILAGAALGGILGIVFAIPVMVVLEEIIAENRRRRGSEYPSL